MPRFWDYSPAANQRLDSAVYSETGRPTFVTIRCARHSQPFLAPANAATLVDCLRAQQAKSRCHLIAYCVMPDHLHLIVAPAAEGTSVISYVDRLKGWSSRRLHLAGWVGPVWQPRSYDHVLRQHEALEQTVAYILQNPVRRGLCQDPEEYPWAALLGWPDPDPDTPSYSVD